MRLGQVHRAGPFAGDHVGHDSVCFSSSRALDQQRRDRARGQPLVHFEAVVGGEDIFADRGADDLRQPLPAIFLRRRSASASRPRTNCSIGLLEARRRRRPIRRRVRLQPTSSPTRLSGCSTSAAKRAAFLEDRLDQVGRRVGEARQVRIAADVEHVVEDEARFAHRRGVGRHSAYLRVSSVLLRSRADRPAAVSVRRRIWRRARNVDEARHASIAAALLAALPPLRRRPRPRCSPAAASGAWKRCSSM